MAHKAMMKNLSRWIEHIVLKLFNPLIVSAFMVPGAGLFHELWMEILFRRRTANDNPKELWNRYGDKLCRQWYVIVQNLLDVDTEMGTFSVPAYWRLTSRHRPPSGKFHFRPYETREEMEMLHDAYVQMKADDERFEHNVRAAVLVLAGSIYGRNNIQEVTVTGERDGGNVASLRRSVRARYPPNKKLKLKIAMLRNAIWHPKLLKYIR